MSSIRTSTNPITMGHGHLHYRRAARQGKVGDKLRRNRPKQDSLSFPLPLSPFAPAGGLDRTTAGPKGVVQQRRRAAEREREGEREEGGFSRSYKKYGSTPSTFHSIRAQAQAPGPSKKSPPGTKSWLGRSARSVGVQARDPRPQTPRRQALVFRPSSKGTSIEDPLNPIHPSMPFDLLALTTVSFYGSTGRATPGLTLSCLTRPA